MKKVNLVFLTLVLAVVFLIIEVAIVRSLAKYEPQVNAVFAKTRIPADAVIQDNMLMKKKIDASVVHKQSLRDIEDVVGKVAKTDIEEGEMILVSRLAEDDGMEDITLKDKNNRLFTVEFKGDQANGWWLMAGQYVDLIFVPRESDKSMGLQDDDIYAAGLRRLRNIRIAALIDDRGKLLKKNDKTSVPRYISFEVSEGQDEFLAYAKGNGRIEISVTPGNNSVADIVETR